MDNNLLTLILQISVGCAMTYYILNFLKQKKKDLVTFDIKNLEARMASLRMILKAKVKKKSQYFRASFSASVKKGDPFDLALTELAELPFETNDHFEKYFSSSKQLNTFLKIDRSKSSMAADAALLSAVDTPAPVEVQNLNSDFMTTDIKNEFIIIKTIHEMIELSISLKTKIDHYNLMHPKLPLAEVKVIQFPSVVDVQKIFSEQASNLQIEKTAA